MLSRSICLCLLCLCGNVLWFTVPAVAQQERTGALTSTNQLEIDDVQLQLIVNVVVASKDSGKVEALKVSEGAMVAESDVLVQLDQDSFMAESAGARAELEIAIQESQNDVDLRYAKVSREVSGKVYQRSIDATRKFAKSVSKTELERLKLELERARLSGEQAVQTQKVNELTVDLKQAQSKIADIRLMNRTVRSPVRGMIAQLYRQRGEWVQAGEPIARVIDLENLRVSFRCQLADVSPGDLVGPAEFTCDGQTYEAQIVFASPEIDPDIQDFLVWAEVVNTDGKLNPGMRGSIKLTKKD